MKSRWLMGLLVVSLLANSVELVVFGVGFVRRRAEQHRLFKSLQARAPRWHKRPLLSAYHPAWDSLGRLLAAADSELWALNEQQSLDSARLAAAVEQVVSLELAMTRQIFASVQALHRPEYDSIRPAKLRQWQEFTGLDRH